MNRPANTFTVAHDDAPPALKGAVVAIGNFDGVHRGHRAVIDTARRRAATLGKPVAALTFSPHPRQFFRPDVPLFRLSDDRNKLRLLAATGLDGAIVMSFDAAEFNNATSDRILGFADVSKVYMLQSYHQNAEQFEISFNKTKFDALPPKVKAVIENAVEAASQDMSWKAIDRYSKDYVELQTKDNVKVYKTPDAILKRQLEIFDEVAKKYAASNPLFKKIVESQVAFAKRATQWENDTVVSRKMAYDHYFGPNAKSPI